MLYKNLIKLIPKQDLNNFYYLMKSTNIINIDEKNEKTEINENKIKKILKILKKSRIKPIQYLIGNVDFYGYIYKVNNNVLIPRFETEELVENIIEYINNNDNKNLSILDVGTGSGCIGITLKKEIPTLSVTLLDISRKALRVAKKNSGKEDIKFIRSNMLKKVKDKYDIIVSNPPYISHDEPIMKIVKDNEPKIALYAKNNGLYYYDILLNQISKNLNNKFLIALEIGYKQKEDVINIAKKYLSNIEIKSKKDLQGRDRMIFIKNKK